jgi:hypothetical protein
MRVIFMEDGPSDGREEGSTNVILSDKFSQGCTSRHLIRHPGESRDPFLNQRGVGKMDPGFRRDDD